MKNEDLYGYDKETVAQYEDMFKKTRMAGLSIGLPEKFLDELIHDIREDNDWTFIIKAHAIIETALNKLLAKKIYVDGYTRDHKQEAVSNFITRLPIGGRNGKLQLAESLDLIKPWNRAFIDKLSEIRNFYIHDLSNINTTVREYIFERHKNRKQEFCNAFYPFYKDAKELVDSMPDSAITLAIFMGICTQINIFDGISKPRPSILSILDNWKDEEA